MKVIQVVNYSVSKLNLGFDPLAFEHDWHIILAKEILKRTKRYEIECWQPERTLSEVYTREKDGITHRRFPSFYIPAPSSKIRAFEFSIQLLRELKRQSAENEILIHEHTLHSPPTYLIALLFKHLPIVVQDHSSMLPGLFQKCIPEKIPFRYIDHFFLLTRERRDYLSRLVGTAKLELQTMGTDLALFRPRDKAEARRDLNLPLDGKIMLFVGNITKRKGVDYLIRALPSVSTSYPDVLCLVVGGGSSHYIGYLKKLASELNVAKHIRFLGRVEPDSSLAIYYGAADVFVLPSLHEGAPVTIMEALASDRPVIATNVGAIPDMVAHLKTGLLIPPGDSSQLSKAAISFFENHGKFGACRQVAQQIFDWDKIVGNTTRVYEELFATYYHGRQVQ